MLNPERLIGLLKASWRGAALLLLSVLAGKALLYFFLSEIPESLAGSDRVLEWLRANPGRGMAVGAVYFLLQTYGLMGYWGCLKEAWSGSPAGAAVFFHSANRMLARGISGQLLLMAVAVGPVAVVIGLMALSKAAGKPYSGFIALASMALLLPATIYTLWSYTRLSLWLPSMCLKDQGAAASLRGSYAASAGSFWRVLLVVLLPYFGANLLVRAKALPALHWTGSFLSDYALPVIMPAVLLLLYLELTAPAPVPEGAAAAPPAA